jgi:hypothetical protein
MVVFVLFGMSGVFCSSSLFRHTTVFGASARVWFSGVLVWLPGRSLLLPALCATLWFRTVLCVTAVGVLRWHTVLACGTPSHVCTAVACLQQQQNSRVAGCAHAFRSR